MSTKDTIIEIGTVFLAGPVLASAVGELVIVGGFIAFNGGRVTAEVFQYLPFVTAWWHLLVVPFLYGTILFVAAFLLLGSLLLAGNVLDYYWQFGLRDGWRKAWDPKYNAVLAGSIDHPTSCVRRRKRCPECSAWSCSVAASRYDKTPSQVDLVCSECGHEFRRRTDHCSPDVGYHINEDGATLYPW